MAEDIEISSKRGKDVDARQGGEMMNRRQLGYGACPLAVLLVVLLVVLAGCGGGQETIAVEEEHVPEGSVEGVETDVTDQYSITSVDNTPGVVGYVEVFLMYEWR